MRWSWKIEVSRGPHVALTHDRERGASGTLGGSGSLGLAVNPVIWPFSCRGCKSKDSEIAFLRGQFASMRTVYKNPIERPDLNSNVERISAGVPTHDAAPADPEQPQVPGYFFRDCVQDFDPTKDDR